jgi:hypothetical protein
MMMMLSDLSSEHEHEATGSSSYGGDMTSYALSPPLFLAPAASATTAPLPPPPPPPQLEEPNKAAGTKRKRSQPGNPGT